jgi:hypothetical protein
LECSAQRATTLLLLQHRAAYVWMSVAGFGMLIWILAEVVIIQGFSALHAIYFGAGIIELALVLFLVGVVPRVSPPTSRSAVERRDLRPIAAHSSHAG